MPEIQVRNYSVHHASIAELLGSFSDPQLEEAEFPQYDPHLFEIDEQRPLGDSCENVDSGSQSSTSYSAEGPPYLPRIDGAQSYMPQRSPFSQENYPVGLPPENNLLQSGEHSRSVDTVFQQQGNHIGATSALDLGDNSRHIISGQSSTTLPPGFEPHRVNHAGRNVQATFRTGRRSSLERHPHLDTSNPAIIQTPSISRSFADHANTTDRQVNPLEQVTADGMGPSLISPFVDGGVLDWTNGNETIDLSGTHRSFSVDSGLPGNATSRAHSSHIGPSASEPRRNSQSSYQSGARYPFQPQAQGARRGTRGSPSLMQGPSMFSYGMQSLDNDRLARKAHELIEGVQADNSPAGNEGTYLSPTWKPAHMASSETRYDKGLDVSDNVVRQRPHIIPTGHHRVRTRGFKREHSSDSPPPTTTPLKRKRTKRPFTEEEKAQIKKKRKTGACNDCRRAKRKVCESL